MTDGVFPESDLKDKLDSLLPPEGVIATRLRDVAARIRKIERGRADARR